MLVSLIGTWMQQVGQAWLVLQLTNDPLALGIIAMAQFGPILVLGPFGGIVADSVSKRAALVVTQLSAVSSAIDRATRVRRHSSTRASASSRRSVDSSTYWVASRRSTRDGSISTISAAAPFIVAASGWAPPIPPRPAVTTSRPLSVPPKWRFAAAAKVS